MPDLKAAANVFRSMYANKHDFLNHAPMNVVLAAQALEALAWQAEKGALTQPGNNGWWVCVSGDGLTTYAADTPLGAMLAAMEGEKSDT